MTARQIQDFASPPGYPGILRKEFCIERVGEPLMLNKFIAVVSRQNVSNVGRLFEES